MFSQKLIQFRRAWTWNEAHNPKIEIAIVKKSKLLNNMENVFHMKKMGFINKICAVFNCFPLKGKVKSTLKQNMKFHLLCY